MQGKEQTRRVHILVKAYPQPSKKYEETVCCAGIAEDTGELLRLFPIRYRRLPKEERFERFDLVEMSMTRASSDTRPESFHINEDSIKLIASGKQLSQESKVRLWLPHVTPSLKALMEENKQSRRSLGIVKPDPDSLKFVIKEAASSGAEDQEVADMLFQQASLLEDPLKPLQKPKYSFYYHYTCDGHPHKHQIHDWEVQAAFMHYKRRYQTEEEALKMMRQEYGENIPKHNLHFIMGTMKAHPHTFIVIGLLRTSVNIEEFDKQQELF